MFSCPDNLWLREILPNCTLLTYHPYEQIALMGVSLLKKLLSDITSAELFSVIPHEATDVSNKEQMIICIRWVDEVLQYMEIQWS